MSDNGSNPKKMRQPRHVAIIMDGNGRWAVDRGKERLEGHRKGADVVRDITTYARELEIPYLTLYSFSVQNWSRPPEEVAGLMGLLEEYCVKERATLMDNEIRLNTIGETDKLPPSTREALADLIEDTADHRKMTLTLAIDYGGREEIVAAVRRLAHDIRSKRIAPDKIDESAIETRLDTALLPDPDLVIRTSGEMRISNFLLWQIAYAELYFTDVRWPEFSTAEFDAALAVYASRERRFGATSEQLTGVTEESGVFVMGELPETDDIGLEEEPGPC